MRLNELLFNIILPARKLDLGLKAVDKLEREDGLKVEFHQLDVNDQQSIQKFADFIKLKHNRLDILVNNAGIVGREYSVHSNLKFKIDFRANI